MTGVQTCALPISITSRPTYAERDLPVLIQQVSELSYAQGHAVITHWKTLVDAETDPEPDGTTNTPPSEFHVSPGLDSEFEVHGHLDTLDGLTVTTALDSAQLIPGPPDRNALTPWYSSADTSSTTTPPDPPPAVNDPMWPSPSTWPC